MRTILRWIEEYARAEQGVIPAPELDKRIVALRELASNVHGMNATQFQEAMTTAHFVDYFADALSRAFYSDYAYQVGDWKGYIYPDTTPDFRDVDRFRMSEPGGLYRRREKAEHKATNVQDSEIHYGVDEFSREFDVSWQTILNDDLGKIKETPQRMAKAAARWLDEFVSALFDNATTQLTIAALGAPWAGTGALTLANLAIGVNAMYQRTDAAGNRMNITKLHLVIPPILKIQAAQILQDVLSNGGPGSNVMSQFLSAANVHVDPFIDTTVAAAWYLFADPSEIPTVTLARLTGWPGPVTVMKRSNIQLVSGSAPAAFLMGDFTTGDIEFAVEDVVGGWDDAGYVGVTDFRGLYYSSGTTP